MSANTVSINGKTGPRTVLRLEIAMQNYIDALPLLAHQASVAPRRPPTNLQLMLRPRLLRILAGMTPVQGADQLRENRPHKVLLRILIGLVQLLHQAAQVPVAAIFHVQMEVGGCLDVFSALVLHDVGVDKLLKDGDLGVQLLPLFVRHPVVGNFFPTHDLASGFVAHFANDAEGALA